MMMDEKGIIQTHVQSTTDPTPIPDRTRNKAVRRKNPKVKTGCATCKIRRVKCDETKPFCLRCHKFGVTCGGYPSPVIKQKPTPPTRANPPIILPKAQRARLYSSWERPSITNIHFGPRFEDEQEGRCFRIYIEQIASQIQGPFRSRLWDQLIPQISEAEPFIRHAVVAIGAIGKILLDQRTTSAVPKMAVDYPFALKQFDKALRGMRNAITNGESNVRKALIACILVFCFETLAGKPGSALVNAESGLMLLYQFMRGIDDDDEKGLLFLGRDGRYQSIEEDVMDGLAGLDLQVLFFLDQRPVAVHQFMIDGANKTISRIPESFSTLNEARSFWSLIMRRNYHFIKMALVIGKSELSAGDWKYDRDEPWSDSANLGPGGNIFSTPREPVWDLIPESVRYREDLKRWRAASDPVFDHISENGTEQEKVVCALLQIHQIMNKIMLQGTFFVNECSYDFFLSDFKKMMSLINYVHPLITSMSPNDAPYHFNLGLIPPLYFIGIRCRDRGVRDNVIELISKVHYREGMWDSLVSCLFVMWVKELEDQGRDEDDYVPEHKRVFLTSAFVDLEGKRAIIQATRKAVGGREFLEKVINWT